MKSQNHKDRGLYSIVQTAEYLGVSESWVRQSIRAGNIDSVPIGRRRMVRAATIDHIVEHGCEGILRKEATT